MTGPAPADVSFPASLAQQRLWFLAGSDPTGVAYNISKAIVIAGPLDVDALSGAIARVVERHETLRTRFGHVDGQLVQIVSPAAEARLVVDDAPHADDTALPAHVSRLAQAEARLPFDLARGPLVRARLYRLGEGRFLFCLTLHHIICDAWSLALLYREVTSAYGALARRETPDLGEPPLQYGDFAVWERQQDAGRELALAYWRTALAGLPERPNWPADHPRPAMPTWEGARVPVALPPGTGQAVRALARAERTTPAVVLLSAFAAFLHRWTGDSDLPVGTPVAGRDRVELEPIVGCFVNTLVTRYRVTPGMTFRQLVAAGRTIMLEALRHQAAPLESVVQAVRPRAGGSTPPLFSALFTHHAVGDDTVRHQGGLEFASVPASTRTAKADVSLVTTQTASALTASLACARDLFDPATAAAAAERLGLLMGSAVRTPDATLAALPFATSGEPSILHGPMPSGLDETNLHALFVRAAEAHAEALAVAGDTGCCTYEEMRRWSDNITAALEAAGVEAGALVGVLGRGDAPVFAAMIGIVGAGGVYVPIDQADPPAHIAAIVEDAGLDVVVTNGPQAATLPPGVRTVDARALRHGAPDRRPAARPVPAAACLIYTSGTTGRPKGVLVPHRGITRLVLGASYLDVRPGDRVGQASNIAFDAAALEIWGALLNGGTLVPIGADTLGSPSQLAETIRTRALSILFVTTAVFNRVARSRPDAFAPLRLLLFGGEAASASAVAAVLAASRPGAVIHAYGPTECTTFATVHRVEEVAPDDVSVPIGRPIALTSAMVADPRGEPVARGQEGELWLAGDGLALGYHQRPEETAERFVTRDDTRWYRTGDRCRMTPGGVIEFVGRADRQVKVRGFRLEPAGIEQVLASHPAVAAAAVDVMGEEDNRRLVACVACHEADPATPEALRRFLLDRLPGFAVPAIALVDELPLTANGKIDRRRLAACFTAATGARAVVPPRDPLEEELVRLWEEVLEVAPIGVTDDFFAVGGHSLLAAALLGRIEATLGVRVPVAVLLEQPTIAGLAERLWRQQRESPDVLATLRSDGARAPLFFLHGDLNGAGLYCARLARELSEDQPVYTLAPLGLDRADPPPSIEAMAAEYIGLIEARCPDGPFAIGGYCHGALIAYEIARRLEGEGRVTHVLMVHPPPVEPRLAPIDAAIRAGCRLFGWDERARVDITLRLADALRVLAGSTPRGMAAFAAGKLRRLWSGRPTTTPVPATAPSLRHDPSIWTRYLHAIAAYVPRRYGGTPSLLVGDGRSRAAARGWLRAAPGARVIPIPGDHRGCVTTHLDSLARAVDNELTRAEAAAPAAAGRRRWPALVSRA